MKTKIILIALLVIAALLLISLKIYQTSEGPHGGTVKRAEGYNIEMKNSHEGIFTFLLDKNLKPINNKGISFRLKLFYPDDINTDSELKPFGEDGFFSESIPKYYSSCEITFHVSGKNISAEFENETLFVKKK